jgi:heme-degrading monooxygenase HmoA
MYIDIRTYDLIAGAREEFIQHVQERLIPLLNHTPGFRAFSLVEVADNTVTFISTFHTLSDAQASSRLTKDWTVENSDFIQDVTKVAAGQLRVGNELVRVSATDYEEVLRGTF